MKSTFFALVMSGILWLWMPCPSHSQTENTKVDSRFQSIAEKTIREASTNSRSSMPSSLQLSTDEIYALLKLRIQKELEDEISKWVQTKFWFAAIASLLIGFFGVRALVREFVSAEIKDAMRASAEAQAAATSARESIKEVRSEASKYKDLVDAASATASSVNEKLQELSSRIDTEGERSIAAAEIKISALSEQLDAVLGTVSALASNTEQNRQIIRESEASIVQARKTAETSEAEFLSNSHIKVTLVPYPDGLSMTLADFISKDLTNSGFKISRSPWGNKKENFKGNIEIAFQAIVKEKAEYIAELVKNLAAKNGLSCNVKLESNERPMSNTDANIVVLFN